MSDSNVIGISVLALTQAVTIYHQFLPPLTEIRKTDRSDHTGVMDVRIGEAASAALTIGVGAILSSMTKQKQPLLISVIASLILVGIYEYVLGCDPS